MVRIGGDGLIEKWFTEINLNDLTEWLEMNLHGD